MRKQLNRISILLHLQNKGADGVCGGDWPAGGAVSLDELEGFEEFIISDSDGEIG